MRQHWKKLLVLSLVAFLASLTVASCAMLRKPIPVQPENQGEIQTRPADDMTMVYVPGGAFRMGSSEPEIEAAIALCNQHYNTCNRRYYMRESPQQFDRNPTFYYLYSIFGGCQPALTYF